MYVPIRIASALPTLLGVTLFAFLLVHMAPGDPLAALTGGRVPQTVFEELRAFYGFDRPLSEQYLHWLGRILSGDFGASLANGRRVAPELFAALDDSLKLILPAAPIAVLGAWWLGQVAAWRRDAALGRTLVVVFGALVSVPSYWLGLVLVALFGVTLNWLPVMGMGPATIWAGLATPEGLGHMVLPVLALIVAPMGILARSTKTAVEAAIAQDYVEALRARGASERQVMRRVARNALPGLLPLYALQVSYMLGGLVLVEAIFAWPGIGTYLISAISARDMPSVQAGILVLASVFVLLNLLADLLQNGLDPRTKR